jgi:hypothetical protein
MPPPNSRSLPPERIALPIEGLSCAAESVVLGLTLANGTPSLRLRQQSNDFRLVVACQRVRLIAAQVFCNILAKHTQNHPAEAAFEILVDFYKKIR